MKLYRSGGGSMAKKLLGEVNTPEELAELFLRDGASRYNYTSGRMKFEIKPGVLFAEKHLGGVRYTLEED